MSTLIQKTVQVFSNQLISKINGNDRKGKPDWQILNTFNNGCKYMIDSIKVKVYDVLRTIESVKSKLLEISANNLLELAHNVSCQIRHKILLIDSNHPPIGEKKDVYLIVKRLNSKTC